MSVHSDDERPRGSPDDAFDPDLVEYVVMTTADLDRSAAIAGALRALVETSQIRILDLVGVSVDHAGGYVAVEPEALAGFAELGAVDGEVGGLLSDDDIALACSAMRPGTSALILVVEDRWAGPLAEAVRLCGGRIVGGEHIPRDRVEQSRRGVPDREGG